MGRKHSLPPEHQDAAQRLYEDHGFTIKQLAGTFGVSITIIHRLLKKRGVEFRPPGEAEDKKRNESIRGLNDLGFTYAQIGDHYGLSRQRVHQIIKGRK